MSDGEARVVCEPEAEAEALADSVAASVAVAWAEPPGLITIRRPAAAIATTAIALTAITTDLWPANLRLITFQFSSA